MLRHHQLGPVNRFDPVANLKRDRADRVRRKIEADKHIRLIRSSTECHAHTIVVEAAAIGEWDRALEAHWFDHLLIDVADYAHVPAGPGTVLVSLEAKRPPPRPLGRAPLP